jgi:hypothetical protein
VTQYYLEALAVLRKKVMRVRMEVSDDVILGASSRQCARTDFLHKKCIPLLLQTLYFPDLSPCDFYLYPEFKLRMKGDHFHALYSVQKAVPDAIKTPKEANCQSCCEARRIHGAKHFASEGCDFEEDIVDLDE